MSLYRVWVRGIDARGEATNWSPRQEFFIAVSPSTEPTALSTFDTTPTLRWEAVNGARKYEIWLRNMFTGADVTRVANITQTDWTAPAALPNARYQWWVRAFGDYNVTGLWSTGRMLWVGGQPANLNASVAPNARVSFQWGTVEGVFLYQLQVDRIDVPQTRVIREDSLLSNSFQTQFALSTGTYRAWVRAISSTGLTSFWSKEVMFTV